MRHKTLVTGLLIASICGDAGCASHDNAAGKVSVTTPFPRVEPSVLHPSKAALEISQFYNDLRLAKWSDALRLETPSFRRGLTVSGFAAGYATTRSIKAKVEDNGSNVVPVTLLATDVYPDGVKRSRKFRIVWTLGAKDGKLLMQSATVKVISDTKPAEDLRLAQEKAAASAPPSPPSAHQSSGPRASISNGCRESSISDIRRPNDDANVWYISTADGKSYDAVDQSEDEIKNWDIGDHVEVCMEGIANPDVQFQNLNKHEIITVNGP
jgi:hypothetical protein